MSLERNPIFQDALTAKKRKARMENAWEFVKSTFFPLLDSPEGYDSVGEGWLGGALVGYRMAHGLEIGGDFGALNLYVEVSRRFEIAHEDKMKIGLATDDYNRLAATFSLLQRLDLETIDDDLDLGYPDKES